jgi:hypothetical protein
MLVAKDLRLVFKAGQALATPPADPLPTSPEVERLTYTLFEESAL